MAERKPRSESVRKRDPISRDAIALVSTAIFVLLANASLIGWFHTESRNDWRQLDGKVEIMRQEARDFREMWARESKEFNDKWAQESKEFHGRLIEIEQSRKN